MAEGQRAENIHTDNNGVTVTAMSTQHKGEVLWGHSYMVSGLPGASPAFMMIDFQKGPVKLNSPNGLTSEALLAILIHRTEHLDSLFPCVQNRHAVNHMRMALELLEARTKERMGRGVEGLNVT
jgi:hypothetical protein